MGNQKNFISVNQTALGNVDTVQELSDILVSDSADLLDVGGVLGNSLQGVTRQDQLILLGRGLLNGDTVEDLDLSDSLLTQEVSDLNKLSAVNLNNVDVDWEMRIDVSHLVLVTLGDTGDQVGNQGLDGSQGSDVLSVTVVDGDLDSLVRDLGEGNVDVLELLVQNTSWAGDLDRSGGDVDGNTLWDFQDLVGLNGFVSNQALLVASSFTAALETSVSDTSAAAVGAVTVKLTSLAAAAGALLGSLSQVEIDTKVQTGQTSGNRTNQVFTFSQGRGNPSHAVGQSRVDKSRTSSLNCLGIGVCLLDSSVEPVQHIDLGSELKTGDDGVVGTDNLSKSSERVVADGDVLVHVETAGHQPRGVGFGRGWGENIEERHEKRRRRV